MLAMLNINIADNERGILFDKNNFREILIPGNYRWMNLNKHLRVEVFDITQCEFKHKLARIFITKHPNLFREHMDCYNIGDSQLGLVYQDSKLIDLLQPGSFHLYWKSPLATELKLIDFVDDYSVDSKLLAMLARNKGSNACRSASSAIYYAEVSDSHIGLLMVNGKLEAQLKPGNYGFWRYNRNIVVKHLDCRLQTIEVNGQEILTKDRVSLRINLSANYRVIDTEKVTTQLGDFVEYLYRQLQLALRETVSSRTLDEILVDKLFINGAIDQAIKHKASRYGLQVQDIGVKDIILPGDMKVILNQVVEAQKQAEANVLKRREETQAMRSLHNTAKLMENNPLLLRLKELEALEIITQRVDKLTVYGGLDGVLNDLVKLRA